MNTLTGLIPTIFEALDIVSRERVGMVSAVTLSAAAQRAAKDQDIEVPIAPAAAAEDITPGTTPPDTGDQAFTYQTVKITKSRAVPFRWSGEEVKGVNTGPGFQNMRRDQIAQAIRTIVNEMEIDLCALYPYASRAYGSAGNAPFATAGDLSDIAGVLQILEDNGAPPSDLQLVLGSAAMANLRGKQSSLFKVNEAGSDDLLRRGIIGQLESFQVHNTGFARLHTKGTAAGYLADLIAGYAIGDTALHLDTGTGTHVAGDVITFTGDANKYVINTGAAGDGDKDIVLNKPGFRATLANDVAATTGNNYRANLAFHKGAIVLATRMPALPEEGDSASDRLTIQDPITGMTFEFALYKGYRRVRYEVAAAWGVKAIKSEHIATLMG